MVPEYQRPPLFFSAHIETIYPALFRRIGDIQYVRERIATPDHDFLDLDWLRQGASKVVIISHGLEGNTTRAYMMGMARILFQNGFDVLTWNFRGCGEEMNKQLRFYHSGATEDLSLVVSHAKTFGYKEVNTIGFSLGGNLTLKYLGERGAVDGIHKGIGISVPLDLYQSCLKISTPANRVYSKRFVDNLKGKIIAKSKLMPGLNLDGIERIKTLLAFDDQYTAPLHGFVNAIDYYTRCSSIHFLNQIEVPTLIVNAQNDPFLSQHCFPKPGFIKGKFVAFESPRHGGHVGFAQFNKNGLYWSEERALRFLTS